MSSGLRTSNTESDALKLVDLGKTKRAKDLERYQAYFEGTQYDGRPAYLDSGCGLPRLERKPCIIYPLLSAAVESNASLAMGGPRFPRVLSLSSEDDSAFAGDVGLDPKSSETLDAFNGKLIDTCGLTSPFRQAFRMAQVSRSVALIGCYRNGLAAVDCVWAKLCTPTFDPQDPCTVISLEIRYRYIEWQRDPQFVTTQNPIGEIPVVKEYRRVINDTTDITYIPKEIWDATDIAPSQTPDPNATITHGFGFCPVRWYARQRESYAVGGFDGKSIAEGKLEQLDGINHSLSSRHVAALYTGDPIKVVSGTQDGETFGTVGRVVSPDAIDPMKKTGWDAAMNGPTVTTAAIKAGPGELWRLPDPAAQAYYLALPKGALDALDSHASDLCSRVREALRYVWIDPEKLTGAGDISGKTLAFVFSSQINAVSEDRDDFGRNCILPTLGMLYRMFVSKSDGLYIPGLAKVLPILKKFLLPVAQTASNAPKKLIFIAPQLQLKWGEYFDPSDTDESTRVQTAIAALTAPTPIITLQTAVEHVHEVFAISNSDQYVDALAKEKAQKQADSIANATAMAKANPPAPQVVVPGAAKPAPVPVAPSKGAQTQKANAA